MKLETYIAVGSVFGACLLFRHALEADPVTHVLLQMPLLAWCGAALSPSIAGLDANWNRHGIPLLLVAGFSTAFWMLPKSVDLAVASPAFAVAKYISLPVLIGAPLALGWARAHPLLKGFLKAQCISMLGVLAFLYTHAPVRICNVYLVDDQVRLGVGFIAAAAVLTLIWVIPLFEPRPNRTRAPLFASDSRRHS